THSGVFLHQHLTRVNRAAKADFGGDRRPPGRLARPGRAARARGGARPARVRARRGRGRVRPSRPRRGGGGGGEDGAPAPLLRGSKRADEDALGLLRAAADAATARAAARRRGRGRRDARAARARRRAAARGRGGPTVLVLEDVHWADEATLDVLTMLATRVESAPALVLASYRDDQLERDDRLRLVLGELVRRPARLKLDPLSPDAVAGLARPHGVDPGTLYRRTGGNPFFVVEALAATGEAIPQTVRDAVLARAARLSPRARGLLDA